MVTGGCSFEHFAVACALVGVVLSDVSCYSNGFGGSGHGECDCDATCLFISAWLCESHPCGFSLKLQTLTCALESRSVARMVEFESWRL